MRLCLWRDEVQRMASLGTGRRRGGVSYRPLVPGNAPHQEFLSAKDGGSKDDRCSACDCLCPPIRSVSCALSSSRDPLHSLTVKWQAFPLPMMVRPPLQPPTCPALYALLQMSPHTPTLYPRLHILYRLPFSTGFLPRIHLRHDSDCPVA